MMGQQIVGRLCHVMSCHVTLVYSCSVTERRSVNVRDIA